MHNRIRKKPLYCLFHTKVAMTDFDSDLNRLWLIKGHHLSNLGRVQNDAHQVSRSSVIQYRFTEFLLYMPGHGSHIAHVTQIP